MKTMFGWRMNTPLETPGPASGQWLLGTPPSYDASWTRWHCKVCFPCSTSQGVFPCRLNLCRRQQYMNLRTTVHHWWRQCSVCLIARIVPTCRQFANYNFLPADTVRDNDPSQWMLRVPDISMYTRLLNLTSHILVYLKHNFKIDHQLLSWDTLELSMVFSSMILTNNVPFYMLQMQIKSKRCNF